MTNQKAVEAFVSGKSGRGNNLTSDGRRLYSYQMLIAIRAKGRIKIVAREESPSVTTTKHINMVVRECARIPYDRVDAKTLKQIDLFEKID